jgi:hypothetical protein
MANIILTWEYERDLTHIARLKHLQKRLTEMGHQAYLIGTDLPIVEDDYHLPFLPAPRMNSPLLHKPRAVTKMGGFSDRLALLGFNDAKMLLTLTLAWDHLFALLKPQLLISDSAPIANLAAYQTIPCIQLSDGISMPPAHLHDFPRLRPDAPPLASTQAMLQNVHYVQAQRKKAAPPFLPALLQGNYHFVCHVADFDPYFTFRNKETQHGPYQALPAYPIQSDRQHFFAYLDKNYPDIEEIVISLTNMDKTGIFYIPGASGGLLEYLSTSGMTVHTRMPVLGDVLNQCAWVIHHGNSCVAEAALATGIPQFTLPYNFESDWVSYLLVELGVAVSIYPTVNPIETTSESIREGYKRYSLREWSGLRAQHLMQKQVVPLESAILAACQALLQ